MNNTLKRSLSGILFLAIVLGGLLVDKYLYAVRSSSTRRPAS